MEIENKYGLKFENVHKSKTEQLNQEIIDFWNALNAIPNDQKVEKRVKEVVYIVRNDANNIVAVSTTYIQFIPLLKNNMFMYRCLIHPNHRIPGLLSKLTRSTMSYLEDMHNEIEPKCIGVMVKVESKELERRRLVHWESGLTFCGFAADGNPLRSYFFKGAQY